MLPNDFICMSNDNCIVLKLGHTFAEVVAIRLNVSYADKITPQELVDIFKGVIDWRPFEMHMSSFFDELSQILVKCFMDENAISIDDLTKIYDQLPNKYQSPWFSKYRADYHKGLMSNFVIKRF